MSHSSSFLKEATKLEKEATKRLLERRMLSLVIDLDQTILHAAICCPELDAQLMEQSKDSSSDVHRIVLEDSQHDYWVKLRYKEDSQTSSFSL